VSPTRRSCVTRFVVWVGFAVSANRMLVMSMPVAALHSSVVGISDAEATVSTKIQFSLPYKETGVGRSGSAMSELLLGGGRLGPGGAVVEQDGHGLRGGRVVEVVVGRQRVA